MKKDTAISKVKRLFMFPFLALWTAITGDSGASALFFNDMAKEEKDIQ